jgi:hypothetical protein
MILPLLSTLASLALADDLCGSKTPPTGYRIVVGHASGPRARAIEAAHEAALQNALDLYGGHLSPLQQASFREQVYDWSEDNWVPGRFLAEGDACARLTIAEEAFTAHRDALDRLTRSLLAFADPVRASTTRVDLLAPVWDRSGCAAEIGDAIRTTLRGQLQGVEEVRGGTPLAIRLAALDSVVRGSVTLDGKSLGSFDFPLTVLGVEPGEVGRCAANGTLGLEGDDRRGAAGLTVGLRLGSHASDACEGDLDNPVLSTSAPARVQVFSVDRTGGGHFVGVWELNGTTSLGEGTLTPMPQGGDERLVAVAVPPGSDFGRSGAWTEYCRLPGPFSASWFPESAAIGTTTFIVHPAGMRGCAPGVSGASTVAADAPVCR